MIEYPSNCSMTKATHTTGVRKSPSLSLHVCPRNHNCGSLGITMVHTAEELKHSISIELLMGLCGSTLHAAAISACSCLRWNGFWSLLHGSGLSSFSIPDALKYLFKNTSLSTESWCNDARFCVTTLPAVEKTRSDGTSVPGMHNSLLANFDNFG